MDRALLERMIGAIALVLLLVIVAPALLDGTRETRSDRLSDAQDNQDVRTEIIVLNEPRELQAPREQKPASDPLQTDIIVAKKASPAVKSAEAPSPDATAPTPAETDAKVSAEIQSQAAVQLPPATPAPAATPTVPPPSAPVPLVVAKPPTVVSKPVAEDGAMSKKPTEQSNTASAAAATVKAAGFAVQLGSFGQEENARKYAAELSGRGFAAFVRSGSTATGPIHRVYAGPRPSRDAAEQLASVLGSAGYRGIVVDLSAGNGMR